MYWFIHRCTINLTVIMRTKKMKKLITMYIFTTDIPLKIKSIQITRILLKHFLFCSLKKRKNEGKKTIRILERWWKNCTKVTSIRTVQKTHTTKLTDRLWRMSYCNSSVIAAIGKANETACKSHQHRKFIQNLRLH